MNFLCLVVVDAFEILVILVRIPLTHSHAYSRANTPHSANSIELKRDSTLL